MTKKNTYNTCNSARSLRDFQIGHSFNVNFCSDTHYRTAKLASSIGNSYRRLVCFFIQVVPEIKSLIEICYRQLQKHVDLVVIRNQWLRLTLVLSKPKKTRTLGNIPHFNNVGYIKCRYCKCKLGVQSNRIMKHVKQKLIIFLKLQKMFTTY